MKTKLPAIRLFFVLRAAAMGLLFFASPWAPAQTLWTGPDITFTQGDPDASDQITPGVAISRGGNGPLYNSVTESGSDFSTSPADTLWAFGTIDNYSALSYQTFASFRNGDLAGVILNQPMVLQLVNEQIYISIEFSAWGQHGAGGFSYVRSTAAAAPPTPTVTITNPAGGTVYAAPANVNLAANASVNDDTIASVKFFTNGTLLGTALTAPYNLTANNLAAGSYALMAVATTASSVSATSAVVNVTVVAPVGVSLSAPKVTNSIFSFNYTANPGLTYVVQSSSNLVTWIPLATNMAASNPVLFTNGVSTAARFYRVGRVLNP